MTHEVPQTRLPVQIPIHPDPLSKLFIFLRRRLWSTHGRVQPRRQDTRHRRDFCDPRRMSFQGIPRIQRQRRREFLFPCIIQQRKLIFLPRLQARSSIHRRRRRLIPYDIPRLPPDLLRSPGSAWPTEERGREEDDGEDEGECQWEEGEACNVGDLGHRWRGEEWIMGEKGRDGSR